MLSLVVKHWIIFHGNGACFITMIFDWLRNLYSKALKLSGHPNGLSASKGRNHILSSTIEREIVGCFLLLHEIQL